MYTVSLTSHRFRWLVIIFAGLPLLALLVSSLLMRSGWIQVDENSAQATPPPLTANELLPHSDLPLTINHRQLAAEEVPLDSTDRCAGIYYIPDPDLCTSIPDKSPSGSGSHPPVRPITDPKEATTLWTQSRQPQ